MTNIKAVILVGSLDFGRCPLGSRLNRGLWPVFGKPALQRTIDLLCLQGLTEFRICCQGEQAEGIEKIIKVPSRADAVFLSDNLPRGPAGCLRDAADLIRDDVLVVVPANIISVPDVQQLCQMHNQSKSPFSVFLNPAEGEIHSPQESGVYMCTAQAAKIIPECGFMDIKEGLIRELVHVGTPANAFYLEVDSGNYRTWPDYIQAVLKHLLRHARVAMEIDGYIFDNKKTQWLGADVKISPEAQISGPVVIGAGSVIDDGVQILGPAVIGQNVSIGNRAVVQESIIWNDAVIGPGAEIQSSLLDYGKIIADGSRLSRCLAENSPQTSGWLKPRRTNKNGGKGFVNPIKVNKLQLINRPLTAAISIFFVLLALMLYSYWPTLRGLWKVWLRNDEYSSGLLVPVAAAYILWNRRDIIKNAGLSAPSLWAFAILIAAQVFRLFGLYYRYVSIERLSFVLSLGALVLIFPGKRIFIKCLPVLIFLFLMLPLPKQMEIQITAPLQRWATSSAVFLLETFGFSVWQEGNIIRINDTLVAVAEACNGLRMLTAFLIVSGMTVLLIQRSVWEKSLILLSSIPIALICNTARLSLTAVMFTFLDTRKWEEAFHDFGGFAMMPIALVIIGIELWFLSAIVIDPTKSKSVNSVSMSAMS